MRRVLTDGDFGTEFWQQLATFQRTAWRCGRWSGDNACNDGPCVAIADGPDGWVAVTDTKNPGGPALTFTPDEWADFKVAISNGEL